MGTAPRGYLIGRTRRHHRRVRLFAPALTGLIALSSTGCGVADSIRSAADVTRPTPPLDNPVDPYALPPDLVVPFYNGNVEAVEEVPSWAPQSAEIIERRDPLHFGEVKVYSPGRYATPDGGYDIQLMLFHGDDKSIAVVGNGDRFTYAGVVVEVVDVAGDGVDSKLKVWLPQPASEGTTG